MRLSLYYPAKPYQIHQAWGVYNPAYEQFGFNHHNGIDFGVDTDGIVRAMCDGKVTETGYNPTGSGKYVKYRTGPVECEGITCLVEFYYMHADHQLVQASDILHTGDAVIVADNTGFSTGPHTHISAYRLSLDGTTRLDNNPPYGDTFDHSKYFNGLYADDILALYPAEFGETSENVHRIQLRLISLGYSIPNGPTGFYGLQTKSAVFAFQRDKVQLSWYEEFILRGSKVGSKTLTALTKK